MTKKDKYEQESKDKPKISLLFCMIRIKVVFLQKIKGNLIGTRRFRYGRYDEQNVTGWNTVVQEN